MSEMTADIREAPESCDDIGPWMDTAEAAAVLIKGMGLGENSISARIDARLIANAPGWLTALCDRLEAAEAEIERLQRVVNAEDLHANLAPGETCRVCVHLEAEGLAEQLEAEMDRADAAEAKLDAVKRIHGWMERYEGGRKLGSFCTDCGTTYPCDTRRAAEGVQP